MKSIGLVGLGNAGRPLAERLLQKGYQPKVYDLNPEAMEAVAKLGALKAASAGDATSKVTMMVLPSSTEVRAAVFDEQGILAGLQPGSILLDLSGTDPECARELERKIEERDAHFLGATLHAAGAPSVTIPKGLLSIVVGGKKEPLEACLGILKDLAQKVVCVREPWMPKVMKIAVIMFAATSSILSAEVFAWLLSQRIDPRLFLELLKTTGSRESAERVEAFLRRNRSYGGALSNSYKDIHQALEVAANQHFPLPLMSLVNQIQEMGRAQGLTRTNTPAAMGKLYEILTGIDLSHAVLDGERTFPEPHEPQVVYLEELVKKL